MNHTVLVLTVLVLHPYCKQEAITMKFFGVTLKVINLETDLKLFRSLILNEFRKFLHYISKLVGGCSFKAVHTMVPPLIFAAWQLKPFLSRVTAI